MEEKLSSHDNWKDFVISKLVDIVQGIPYI